MTVYVFTGPSLSPDEGRAVLDAVYLPPVAQGDVYRAALRRPVAIGIVDGYFERLPAVWHKEILWAMAQGIHVFGSASMGALRAAELAAFGMEGRGKVFEAYRDGALEDDDEVAVAHEPADSGYRAQSEAMVNIRATLAAAEAAAVVASSTRATLEDIAKALFYPERVYPLILQRGAEQGLPGVELAALREWLPLHRVDQKRADALAMLQAMREWLAADPAPKRVAYRFEHTVWWDETVQQAAVDGIDADGEATSIELHGLLDELRLDGTAYTHAYQGALARHLALGEVVRYGYAATAEAVQATADEFRGQRGLLDPRDMEQWLEDHHLTSARFGDLIREEALLGRAVELLGPAVLRRLPDHLRVCGSYAPLLARARDKQRLLTAHGLANPDPALLGVAVETVREWYFARQGHAAPPLLDEYARQAGFADQDEWWRAVVREYRYLRLKEQQGGDDAARAE